MGVIWTKKPWTTQPQRSVGINWANTLTRGLKIAVLPENGGYNQALGILGASTKPTKVPTAGMQSLKFVSGTATPIKTGFIDSNITACSMVAFLHSPSILGNMGIIASNRGGSNGGVVVITGAGGSVPNQSVTIQLVHGAVALLGASSSSPAGAINTRFVPFGFTDVAGGDLRYFIDGVFTNNTTSTSISQLSTEFQIGFDQLDGSTGDFHLGIFFWWNRALSDVEMLSVQRNPWQLFASETSLPIFYVAGGANNTGTLSSTLEDATLAGVGSVTRSGTLAVTLDTATLSGVGGVTRSGTLSSTLADVTLTGIGAVTRSGTLVVTLDAATLSGAGTVAVGTNRDGVLAVTLDNATVAGVGAVTRSATLVVTLDNVTLSGIGTAGQPRTGTLAVALDNVTLSGVGAIPTAPSHGGGNGTGRNLSRKQKKKLKAVESQEWLKAEETARQLLNDRFTKQTPQEKAQALQTYVESLQPVIEALKALTTQVEEVAEVVEEIPVVEITPHQEILSRFDTLEKKLKSVEELVIILMADL